mgnify:CR=1 FL=1
MTNGEKALALFICLLLAGCLTLMGSLIWFNATRPAMLIESCIAAEIKRGAP